MSDAGPVIARSLEDGDVVAFESLRFAEGYIEVTDVIDGVWGTFYRLDGEVLMPEVNEHGWVVRLIPTGTFDLPGLVAKLSAFARAQSFRADGTDPRAFVNELRAREWANRWPHWPRWLDRRMHGSPPPTI